MRKISKIASDTKSIPFGKSIKNRRRKLFELKFERCSIVAGKCGKEILVLFGYYGIYNSELFLKMG